MGWEIGGSFSGKHLAIWICWRLAHWRFGRRNQHEHFAQTTGLHTRCAIFPLFHIFVFLFDDNLFSVHDIDTTLNGLARQLTAVESVVTSFNL